MPLPALSSTQLPEAIPDWTPLDRKRVLEHFMLSRDYENIAEYISFQSDLLPDERVILFFLHAVYANSTKTIELYALYIIGLFNYAKKSFNHLKAWDIDAYLRHLTNKGLKPSSRNTAAATLRSFFRHLVDSGVCTVNPAAFLKRKRNDGKGSLPGHLSHSLGRDELERLFAGMEEVGAPFRDIVLFRVLFMTGLRAEEAVSLKWMNVINWQGRWYLDVLGKGSKARRVYLPQKAQAALEELRRHPPPRPEYPIFENLRHRGRPISRHGLYALVKKWSSLVISRGDVSPHWFRHSCFTQLASRGARLESIQALAGHANIQTTMHYNEAAQLMSPASAIFDEE